MYRWLITIENWPYSGVDQSLAGGRTNSYEVRAEDMRGAMDLADAIVKGIRSNPAVWQAPVVGIVKHSEVA